MFKGLSREAVRSVIDQILWSYWPIWGAPLVTGAAAYLEGYSWTILFLIALGAMTMTTVLLFYGSQWRAAQTTENKIRFGVPFIGKVIPDKTANPAITAIKLGFTLDSIAQFPMEVIIEEVRARIENRQPGELHQRKTVPVEVRGQVLHISSGIDIQNLIAVNKNLEGDFYCKIKYGRTGKANREKEFAYAILLKFDNKLELQQPTVTHVDPKDYLAGRGRIAWQIS